MSNKKSFTTGQRVRLTGEGKYEYYTVEAGGEFGDSDSVRLRPATDYLRASRRDRMDAGGCISALACFVEALAHTDVQHGDERNRREETEYGKPVTLANATTGVAIATMPLSSHTRSVVEKYCAACEKWIEVKGVFGMITWIAEHDDAAHVASALIDA